VLTPQKAVRFRAIPAADAIDCLAWLLASYRELILALPSHQPAHGGCEDPLGHGGFDSPVGMPVDAGGVPSNFMLIHVEPYCLVGLNRGYAKAIDVGLLLTCEIAVSSIRGKS
jgi:hypothetical protein